MEDLLRSPIIFANNSEYAELKTELIRDRLVVGMSDESIREKLLQKQIVRWKKLIAIAHISDETKKHFKENNMI